MEDFYSYYVENLIKNISYSEYIAKENLSIVPNGLELIFMSKFSAKRLLQAIKASKRMDKIRKLYQI